MARKMYNQFCGLAKALDVAGERWTLLIVRDLMSGPKRYSDLAASLEGIGTSLLAARVKQLETDGVVVRRELPPPAASTVYQLTAAGEELAQALAPLAMWGARHHLGAARSSTDSYRPEWSLAVFARMIDHQAITGVTAVIEFVVDDEVAQLQFADGAAVATPGQAQSEPDARVRTNSTTLLGIGSGQVDLTEALTNGDITLSGDPAVLQALLAGLSTVISREH